MFVHRRTDLGIVREMDAMRKVSARTIRYSWHILVVNLNTVYSCGKVCPRLCRLYDFTMTNFPKVKGPQISWTKNNFNIKKKFYIFWGPIEISDHIFHLSFAVVAAFTVCTNSKCEQRSPWHPARFPRDSPSLPRTVCFPGAILVYPVFSSFSPGFQLFPG